MFRAIFNKGIKSINVLTSEFCTKAPIARRYREINNVELVGTLITDSFVLPSGSRALTIKTSISPLKYEHHNINVKTNGDYEAGQRVYIQGKLNTTRVETNEGKRVTSTRVVNAQVYVLDNRTSSTDDDVNSVKILGNVASDPTNKETDSSFSMATHFNVFNEAGEAESVSNFHRVFAYDEAIRKYIRENVGKKDRLLVTGRLEHLTYTGVNGKKVYSGYVVAQNILKIGKRSTADVTSNEDIETTVQN